MGDAPVQPPARVVGPGAGQGLAQPVAIGLADVEVRLAVGRQLVRLVENRQVVGRGSWLLQVGKGALAGQSIHADDDQVAVKIGEGVGVPAIAAGDHPKREVEQRAQLAFPVADQAGRRHDQHAADQAAGEHLAEIEAGHDRLARAGVVGQQETQAGLGKHVLVDRQALVGQRIDARDLGGKGRVGEEAVGQAMGLGDRAHHLRVGGEVHDGRGVVGGVANLQVAQKCPRRQISGQPIDAQRLGAEDASP